MARDAVDHAVLGLIAANADGIHGYRITSELGGCYRDLWALTPGQVYRALERLRTRRMIEGFDQAQTGRPNRRVFKITARGERTLVRWMLSPPTDRPPPLNDDLSVKLLLLTDERTQVLLGVLRAQRALHLQRLSRLGKRRARLADAGFVTRLLLDRTEMRLRSELAWLDIAEEAIAGRRGAEARVVLA
ncbi:MAG: helix-turn-helix transcriptional regulator [bacterium]|nr:helix-turn-helix transcriptional regulator [bacterium]